MKTDLYNLKNEIVGSVELPEGVFGMKWNGTLVEQALIAQQANKRRPWAHAKTRAEVRGGGRKPWKQKGTGRARHGSTRSPLWVGGGKAHGPSKDRNYAQKINKKMKRLALFVALSKKAKLKEIKVFDNLMIEAPKTKILAAALKPMMPKNFKKYDILFVPDPENKMIFRAAHNLPKAKVSDVEALNIYDIMNYKHVFIDQRALEVIAKHFAIKK